MHTLYSFSNLFIIFFKKFSETTIFVVTSYGDT